jgi:probable HAF family extracellular repeat protein
MQRKVAHLFHALLAVGTVATMCPAASYTITDIGIFADSGSHGLGINASGHVTGYVYTSGTAYHAFLYDGTLHDLGVGSNDLTVGSHINSAGPSLSSCHGA